MDDEEKLLYHVWFATKNRKWLLEAEIDEKVKELIPQIAKEKHIAILACETMIDHVHLMLKLAPGDLSRAMFLLKGISSRRIFQTFPELKLDAGIRVFWQARYAFKIVPANALESVKSYISTQKERPEKFVS